MMSKITGSPFCKFFTLKNGIMSPSKHNIWPSPAWDIRVYISGNKKLAYDKYHLSHIAGVICAAAKELQKINLIKHTVTWGGNWDNDGIILYDQRLWDLCHFQLR